MDLSAQLSFIAGRGTGVVILPPDRGSIDVWPND